MTVGRWVKSGCRGESFVLVAEWNLSAPRLAIQHGTKSCVGAEGGNEYQTIEAYVAHRDSQFPMSNATEEVELLLHNARLRDELEPYIDESVQLVHFRQMNLQEENSFLESMLAWERAPALPISCWSLPELVLPRPSSLDDDLLDALLADSIDRLFSVRVVLEMTDHLSNRQLYTLIYRDILPACEKKVDLPGNYLCWRCVDECDQETWLTYYATESERLQWLETNLGPLPEGRDVPFPRKLPRASEQ